MEKTEMRFIVKSSTGNIISRHYKWDRAVERAVLWANKYRIARPIVAYFVVAKPESGAEWQFSRSIFVQNVGEDAGNGSVQTEFEKRSKTIRCAVSTEIDATAELIGLLEACERVVRNPVPRFIDQLSEHANGIRKRMENPSKTESNANRKSSGNGGV